MNKNMITDIKDAKMAYEQAFKNKMNVTATKERLVNILLTYTAEIVEELEKVDYLTQCTIEDAATIQELKKQITGADAKEKPVEKKG